jgi:hypothetical protein
MKQVRDKMISVRATPYEKRTVKAFAAEIIKTNRYLKEADVLRELIGLEDTGLITPEMRRRLISELHSHPHIAASIPTQQVADKISPGRHTVKLKSSKKGGRK